MNHRRAALFLQIPAAYCRSFGGLRWAQRGEAVEFLDGPDAGRTFAFAPEIARFLEGMLVPGKSVPAFGCVLHILYLIGLGERAQAHDSTDRMHRINEQFRDLRSPLRNAGALCAWLCREVPGVADPPDLACVQDLLNGGSWIPQMIFSHPALGTMDYAEQPALEPSEFRARVVGELDKLSDEAVRHWLKHGRGPVEAIEDRLVPFPTRVLAGSMAELERRPRLAGMTRVVGRLEGALSLPPRRLDRSELQTDGYSDLATRGAPEQILPIQFALEDEEFLRRFAGRELLYFHRETPRQPAVQEMLLLLDQGVRTWGDVRLVLAGAAMALARQADRRRIPSMLMTTGDGDEPVDLAQLDREALARLLESSDLSPHPGPMLARLLSCPGAAASRDVVLLTHPRSLDEPEVADAACRIADDAGTRLFAVSVDSAGEVELTELRHGWPVRLGRSRVELGEPASEPPRAVPASSRLALPRSWAGDLDPIPFPFRCGILDRISSLHGDLCRHIDFDESGERILVVGRHGLLFAARVDGGESEVLPRPMIDGEVMRPVRTVIGVAGGFVLVGYHKGFPELAHYDFHDRRCTLHHISIKLAESALSWFYYPDLHTIAGLSGEAGQVCTAVELAGGRVEAGATPRAKLAIERARAGLSPYPLPVAQLSTSPADPWADLSRRAVRLDAETGTLEFRQSSGRLMSLTQLSDGQPTLKGARITCTRHGGDVMAIRFKGMPAAATVFISIARAAVVGTLSDAEHPLADSLFALSRDGHWFARRLNDQQVEVREVPGDRPPVFVTPREDVWIHFASLGRSCLLVREFDLGGPRRSHAMSLIRWDRGRLEVDQVTPAQIFQELGGVVAESSALPPMNSGIYHDCIRFLQVVEHAGLRILIDQYNHLAVLGRDGAPIAMFYVSGSEFAAWMPDGTRLGSGRLIGSETPGAAERMAAVLQWAERGGVSP
ncbi:MAG: hypothetical protein ACLQGP_06605 [Isosphaeraceae bacterium]